MGAKSAARSRTRFDMGSPVKPAYTLPDHLRDGLDLVFVGLNPSPHSVAVGHYFGNPRNRFWAAFNLAKLGPVEMSAEGDRRLLEHGIGFTDLVKRSTPGVSHLKAADYREGAPVLKGKLERYRPLVACFHGVTVYRHYLRHAEGAVEDPRLGPQERLVGKTRLFVTPNPSPANARFSLDDLAGWYRELRTFVEGTKGG